MLIQESCFRNTYLSLYVAKSGEELNDEIDEIITMEEYKYD